MSVRIITVLTIAACIIILIINAVLTPDLPLPSVSYSVDVGIAGDVASSIDGAGDAGTDPRAPVIPQDDGPININTADSSQLQRLSGVGPVIAERIIAYRTDNGNFKSVDELLNVSGIGEITLEKLRPNICVE